MGVGGQCHPLATLPTGKTRYLLYRKLRGPQGQSGWVWIILAPLGFNPRTIQPILSCYTNWAILVHHDVFVFKKINNLCAVWSYCMLYYYYLVNSQDQICTSHVIYILMLVTVSLVQETSAVSTAVEPCDLRDICLAQRYPTGSKINTCTPFTLNKLITFS
jgi:hypothetical protein